MLSGTFHTDNAKTTKPAASKKTPPQRLRTLQERINDSSEVPDRSEIMFRIRERARTIADDFADVMPAHQVERLCARLVDELTEMRAAGEEHAISLAEQIVSENEASVEARLDDACYEERAIARDAAHAAVSAVVDEHVEKVRVAIDEASKKQLDATRDALRKKLQAL